MSGIKAIALLPIPMDSTDVWRQFRHYVERFATTWRKHPPGCDLEILAIVQNSNPTNELWSMFQDLPARFVRYDGKGADLGSHQWFARTCGGNPFLICCTTRMYFHREGWGQRLVEARQSYGPALYGLSCSHEGGRLHVCTRGYALDAEDFRQYPLEVVSRDQGVPFECGESSLYQWMTEGSRESYMVYWSGVFEKDDWFKQPNTFRKGDQSNMLIHDKHTDLWAMAPERSKQNLWRRCSDPDYDSTQLEPADNFAI